MRKILQSQIHKMNLILLGLMILLSTLVAILDYEPIIAFVAGMIVFGILFSPAFVISLILLVKTNKLIKRQEETGYDLDDEEANRINRQVAVSEHWLVSSSIFHHFALQKEYITSIHEENNTLQLETTLREKPYCISLSVGEIGLVEKERILEWYDPLYEIPLDGHDTLTPQNIKMNSTLWKKVFFVVLVVVVIFGVYQFATKIVLDSIVDKEPDYIYFHDYLTSTSQGNLDDISYEIHRTKEEIILYIYNTGNTYAQVDLELYDEQDVKFDTVYAGVIRPGYYTTAYIEQAPAEVIIASKYCYTFDYHVPTFEYEVSYDFKDYSKWVNVLMVKEEMSLENLIELAKHEYANEELNYTGSDCVYVYDQNDVRTVIDQVYNKETIDTSSALYRIDFDLYDYRAMIYEMNDQQEVLLETVIITED